MKRRTPTNVAHSVHERLLAQAKQENRPFNELLQHYAIERFLFRLGKSSHTEKLLLKGALLLRVWKIPMARPTMDIDMLGRNADALDALVSILRDCMTLPVEDDGMRYDPDSVVTEAITIDANYQGWRIHFKSTLGNARVPMQVDIGVGDAVYPAPIWIEYPVLLDQPAPRLLAYTPETAIAEKYQAMVELDMANSRMKDFHDIWTLANNLEFEGERLGEAVRRTFERRATPLPSSIPTALTAEFFDEKSKQTQWRSFLSKGHMNDCTASLADVATALREFLVPITEAIASGALNKMRWPLRGPWREVA